ncbi:MAG: hypothetical protein JWR19_2901 [Pedosphaera sp.]|nr:hypothetical protein [Pedosphaera sp.]
MVGVLDWFPEVSLRSTSGYYLAILRIARVLAECLRTVKNEDEIQCSAAVAQRWQAKEFRVRRSGSGEKFAEFAALGARK